MVDLAMVYDEAKPLAANSFARANHDFTGWATNATGAVVYADGAEVENLTAVDGGVVKLFAVWEAVPQPEPEPDPDPELEPEPQPQPQPEPQPVPPQVWTVTFDANGGEGVMAAQTFTNSVAQALNANAFTRFGWDFAGWATSADGEVVYGDGQRIAVSSGQTLYAQWREVIAGRFNTSFAKAQTVLGALYGRDGVPVGTVQVKAGKVNKKKGTVKISATATLLVDGKAKKVKAKAVNVKVAATSAAAPAAAGTAASHTALLWEQLSRANRKAIRPLQFRCVSASVHLLGNGSSPSASASRKPVTSPSYSHSAAFAALA